MEAGYDPDKIDKTHQGEMQLYTPTDGLTIENTRFEFGGRAGLIDLAHQEHRNLTIRNCHFKGLGQNENWGARLRDMTEMFTVDRVLCENIEKEHGFYTFIMGSARIRGVAGRNIGSQLWQNRPSYDPLPVGEGETIVMEDIEAHDCGLPKGRRPGFAVSWFRGSRQSLVLRRVLLVNKSQGVWHQKAYNSVGGLLVEEHAYVDIGRLEIDYLNPSNPSAQFRNVPHLEVRGGYIREGKLAIYDGGDVRIARMKGDFVIVHKVGSSVIARVKPTKGGSNPGYTFNPIHHD